MDLVREYARHNSEEAFAMLVSRHVNLVYSVALHQLRDASLTEEVTQAVFIILARKAGSLGPKTILSAWLCRTAQYVAANALRTQCRRESREQETYMQSRMIQPEAETSPWTDMAPLLNIAMAELGEKYYSAIVLRFFEGKDLRVGAELGVDERTAQTRVRRGVEKLRKFFVKRGITLSAAVIAGTISANSVQAAPVALAKVATGAALANGAAASASTLTFIKGALKLMAWTKAKKAIVAGLGFLLAASTVIFSSMWITRLQADKISFEVEGILVQNNRGAFNRTNRFAAFVKGDKWLIRTTLETNGIDYIEDAFDGLNIYKYIQLSDRTPDHAVNSSTGIVEADDIPNVTSQATAIWLAYGASRFFDGVKGLKVKPFFVWGGLRSERNRLLDVELQRSQKSPFAPAYIYCQELNRRYQVLQFTNYDNLLVPSEFVAESFPIGAGLTNTPDYTAHGFLTKITKPTTDRNFRPALDGRTLTQDERFPGPAAQYVNTNADWISTNSAKWNVLAKMYNAKAGGLVFPRGKSPSDW